MSTKSLLIFICLLLTILGVRYWKLYQDVPKYNNGDQVSFVTTLLSEPKTTGSLQKFMTPLTPLQQVYVTTGRYPELTYGQTVSISGPVKLVTLGNKHGASTQQEVVLDSEKTMLTMSFPKISLENTQQNGMLLWLADLRKQVVKLFREAIPKDYASLLIGIVFGIKEQMSPNLTEQFKTAGVMHVIAASGMNVTMVGGVIAGFLGIFLKRQWSLVGTVGFIWLYALFAGFGPSIVRASIMGSLAFSSQIFGRQQLSVYALSLACWIMLLFQPQLLFDIGFQLSFAATLGLIVLPGALSIGRIGKIRLIGQDVQTTLLAQIATTPILLANFGMYSVWSLLSNALVLWTVPLLMLIGGVGTLVGMLFAPLGRFILLLSVPLLWYFELVIQWVSMLPGKLEIEELPMVIIIGYYLLLVSMILWKRRGNVK